MATKLNRFKKQIAKLVHIENELMRIDRMERKLWARLDDERAKAVALHNEILTDESKITKNKMLTVWEAYENRQEN